MLHQSLSLRCHLFFRILLHSYLSSFNFIILKWLWRIPHIATIISSCSKCNLSAFSCIIKGDICIVGRRHWICNCCSQLDGFYKRLGYHVWCSCFLKKKGIDLSLNWCNENVISWPEVQLHTHVLVLYLNFLWPSFSLLH